MRGTEQEESNERNPTRISIGFVIGLAIVLAVTGYIVTSSMQDTVHYHEVDEVAADPSLVGATMRLRGTVVEDSHRVREGTLDEHVFLLRSEQSTITVLFQGAVPDQFAGGADVIATGVLLDNETFAADTITTQCPSRYEGEAPTALGNGSTGGQREED